MRCLFAAAVLAAGLSACGDAIPTGDPEKKAKWGRFGETLANGVAMDTDGAKHWVEALLAEYAEE